MNGENGNIRKCIGCGRCSGICSNTDPFKVMMYMNYLAADAKIPDSFFEFGYVMPLPNRSENYPIPEWKGDDAYILPGCIVKCRFPFLEYAAWAALNVLDIKCSELPDSGCCTFPIHFRGLTDSERNSIKNKMCNGKKNIVTLCPGCADELVAAGEDAELIVKFLYKHIKKLSQLKKVNLKVALQPGCHSNEFLEEFDAVIRSVGAKPIGNKMGCCGKSVIDVGNPNMDERQKEIAGADAVIVACPSCFSKYDAVPSGVPVLHIVELVALAAGNGRSLEFHNLRFP